MVNDNLLGGWALALWKIMEFVKWDEDIPNMIGKIKNGPKHQPEKISEILGGNFEKLSHFCLFGTCDRQKRIFISRLMEGRFYACGIF